MNSCYYHSFDISFNFWYIAVPFFMVIMGLLGSTAFYLEEHTLRIVRRGRPYRVCSLLSIFLIEFILMCMISIESGSGILQVCANSLAADDDVIYAFFMTALAHTVLFLIVLGLLIGSKKIGEYCKLGYLTEKRRELKRQEGK